MRECLVLYPSDMHGSSVDTCDEDNKYDSLEDERAMVSINYNL